MISWLKKLFKKKVKVDQTKEEQVKMGRSAKIVIIVGHGNGDSGAEGAMGMDEFDYNSKVAEMLPGLCYPKQISVIKRDSLGIAGAAKRAMEKNGDMTIELHCNAYNGKAKGCCVLTLKDKISISMGQKFSEMFCKKFNRIIRDGDGVVELEKGDRGYFSLSKVNDPPPSILVEPFFIDNKDEWIEPEEYAHFLAEFILSL